MVLVVGGGGGGREPERRPRDADRQRGESGGESSLGVTEPECSESELPLGSESRESRSEHNPPPPRVRAPAAAGTRAAMRGKAGGGGEKRTALVQSRAASLLRSESVENGGFLAVPRLSASFLKRQKDAYQAKNTARKDEGLLLACRWESSCKTRQKRASAEGKKGLLNADYQMV